MKAEYKGDILSVRAVEDCIRATRKYTKGVFSRKVKHPIQGEDFPSRLLTEYYEVYPDTEVSWDMPAAKAWAWVWGDVTRIDVRFSYDYREDKARVVVYGGEEAVRELASGIPGFATALVAVGAQAPVVAAPAADISTVGEVEGDGRPVSGSRKRTRATGSGAGARSGANTGGRRRTQKGQPVVDSPDRVGASAVSYPQ